MIKPSPPFSPPRRRWTLLGLVPLAAAAVMSAGSAAAPATQAAPATTEASAVRWDWQPEAPNAPIGVARGVFPGRVVWARDPAATRWAGHWRDRSDQWWTDANTDPNRVEAMLAAVLRRLTGAETDADAWQVMFRHFNRASRGLPDRAYQPGEIVAIKVNLNNSSPDKQDNQIDASPQLVLALVRQLVRQGQVPAGDIFIYDVRRAIAPAVLTEVWREFRDVRFVQERPPGETQPRNPGYGDHHGLEAVEWVEGMDYSANSYHEAKLIPRQVLQSTYLINLAILKAHSYPYNYMEDGDDGQTAVSLTGKNHFGSIKGTPELHAAINTASAGKPHAYSPMVDLAASPNLGAKTLLFLLDGLYCGRKWRSYPQHFPSPPFNNRVEPYENPDWPASVLASLDGVALDSVGLDILHAQTRNNDEPAIGNRPRILIRENADDYLHEMADPRHAPSGTHYLQGGKPVESLGVHEHWDSDASRRYSRNLDPKGGRGIELIYLPMGAAAEAPAAPSAAPLAALAPAGLPGRGLAQHPFLYAGEWDYRKPDQTMFLVRDGRVVWTYSIPLKTADGTLQEWGDATLLSNGNILFARKTGAGLVSPDRRLLWNYDAPKGTEIHIAQPIGLERVMIVENGNPAKLKIIHLATGATEKELTLPTGNPAQSHGQFRRVRLTKAGTILAAHMDSNKVAEYNPDGTKIWEAAVPSPWAAVRLPNGHTLVSSNYGFVRELSPQGDTVWEFTKQDAAAAGIRAFVMQEANRLANGNTVIASWCANALKDPKDWPGSVQILEVTPDKKIVWALRSWTEPADFGPASAIQLLDEPGLPENPGDQCR